MHDLTLSDDPNALAQTARRFAREKIAPGYMPEALGGDGLPGIASGRNHETVGDATF